MSPIEIELQEKITSKISSYPSRFSPPDYRTPPTSLEPYLPEERYLFAYHKVLPVARKARCDGLRFKEKSEHMLSELWVLICNPALLEATNWAGWLHTGLRRNTWAWANQGHHWQTKRPKKKSFKIEQLGFTPIAKSLSPLLELSALEEAFRLLIVSESRGTQYSKEYREVMSAHKDTLDQLPSDTVKKLLYRLRRNRRNYLARLRAA